MDLGDRMKLYEGLETNRLTMPGLPIIARADGRCFHAFTADMDRPYDQRLCDLMVEVTRVLVQETNARVGHTQSDEISLVWLPTKPDQQAWFGGRLFKMTSQLAALTTAHFARLAPQFLSAPHLPCSARVPTFDARVWQVPSLTEAANYLLWRERDATKNSITSAARIHYSDKQLHGRSSDEKQEMLWQKGINWNDYPASFKRGTFVVRETLCTPFTAEELESLPPKHDARRNPDLVIERSRVMVADMPPLGGVEQREALLFG